jgi:hypothetical protein
MDHIFNICVLVDFVAVTQWVGRKRKEGGRESKRGWRNGFSYWEFHASFAGQFLGRYTDNLNRRKGLVRIGRAERMGGGRNDGWACRRVAHPIPGWTPGRTPATPWNFRQQFSLPRPSVPATASVAAERNHPPSAYLRDPCHLMTY